MSKKLLLIVNPRAGRSRSAAPLFEAVSLFSEAGYLVSVRQTRGPKEATRLAQEEGPGFDTVVCCGGDGTLNETVTGLSALEAPPPLGYIPAGSTNDFAASLGLSGDPIEAAKQILSGSVKSLDMGSFCGRPFVYVASFGAFAKASYSAPQSIKNDLGHLAYILEGVKDLSSLRPYRAKITADGQVIDGSVLFCAITNSTSVGGLVKVPRDAVIMDDGKMELLLVPAPQSPQGLQALVRSLLSQNFSGENGGVILRHASEITVEMPDALPWTLDGEYAPGSKRVDISVEAHKLHMLL